MEDLKYLILSTEFIKKHFLEHHCIKKVARLLSLEPEFDWNIIVELNLTYLHILHITGLNLVTNLRHLEMAHNNIKKIENLDWLLKLVYLDLSYNNITKIENLDKLTAIKFLSLSGNKISKIENLDANSQLNTFFINNNKIIDNNQIFYLKRFKHLRVMGISKNPGINVSKRMIIEQFPKLKYLNSEHTKILQHPLVQQPNDEDSSSENEKINETAMRRLAFLNDNDGEQFLSHMYEGDEVGELFNKWNSEVKIAFKIYAKAIHDNAMELYNLAMKKRVARDEIGLEFKTANSILKKKLTNKSRSLITDFEFIVYSRIKSFEIQFKDEKNTLNTLEENSNEQLTASTYDAPFESHECFERMLKKEVKSLTNRLHRNNDYVNECVMSQIKKYERKLDDELKSFLELTVPIFFNIREAETMYSDVLVDSLKNDVNNPRRKIPEKVLNYFEKRTDIMQAVYKSVDKRLSSHYLREENLKFDVKKWVPEVINDLKNSEMQRFQMVVEEIMMLHERYLNLKLYAYNLP